MFRNGGPHSRTQHVQSEASKRLGLLAIFPYSGMEYYSVVRCLFRGSTMFRSGIS